MNEQDRLAFWTKAWSLPEFRVVHEYRENAGIDPTYELDECYTGSEGLAAK